MSESKPPSSRPEAPAARVQASTVVMRRTFVEHRYGVEARQRWIDAASPALRAVLSQDPKRAGWVPFEHFVEATTLVDRMFGRGDMALAFEVGRFAASHDVGVWRSLVMRHIRPSMLLGIASGIWSHHYDGGRLVSRVTGSTSLSFSIERFPTPHRAHCQSIAGWILGSLEMGPRRNVTVREGSCRVNGGATCEFLVSWTD